MREAVNAAKASKGEGPYSQAIAANGFVFVSGQGPLDPETDKVVEGTIEEQAVLTLNNVKAILEAAGCKMNDVVKVGVFLADMKDFDRFNAVYRTFFDRPLPARTCVEAGLGDILVEIDAIAAIPENGANV
ncbi:Rid family detoxifying hydrolase [Cohnella soli]|uniref:Rid family detoxifying hydrolase n=1 Tax=Cohnella soli TaxID=425005 RepID=A0ABW0HNF3_9BACL